MFNGFYNTNNIKDIDTFTNIISLNCFKIEIQEIGRDLTRKVDNISTIGTYIEQLKWYKNSELRIIDRKEYNKSNPINDSDYIEICFAFGNKFLYFYLPNSKLDWLVKEFNLTKME